MKKRIVILILVLVLAFGCGFYFLNKNAKVILVNDLSASFGESVSVLSYVKSVSNGEIIDGNDLVDTSSLGEKEVSVQVKNRFGSVYPFSFSINVVDAESPVILLNSYMEVTEGENIDLMSLVSVSDNYDKNVVVSFDGVYDFNIPGEYKIYFTAVDSSGNESREEMNIFVKEKVRFDSNGVKVNMTDRTFTTSNGYDAVIKDGVLYVDGYLIANKSYYLPSTYGSSLTSETIDAFNMMKSDASELGLNIYISSGFRSYSTQRDLYNRYVNRSGKTEADTYSARAGHSEHQSGLAFDVNDISQSFANTDEGIWLNENAYKYGFILRYPNGKTNETGYIYEPWHFRYVGVELASKLYNDGDWITLEDYFGVTSEYDY